MTKQQTPAAQAAKLIRKELKKNGIKASVKSQNYAGGSSVKVYLQDELPATANMITSFCSKFKYGHFNAMEDIYEYSNTNDDIPQVSFVFVENEYSQDVKQSAWDWIRGYYHDMDKAPETLNENSDCLEYDHTRLLHTVLREEKNGFWRQYKKQKSVTATI